jgi:hypothetical protein
VPHRVDDINESGQVPSEPGVLHVEDPQDALRVHRNRLMASKRGVETTKSRFFFATADVQLCWIMGDDCDAALLFLCLFFFSHRRHVSGWDKCCNDWSLQRSWGSMAGLEDRGWRSYRLVVVSMGWEARTLH